MRELIFSDSGITLTDPYTAGGEVLMGTLRIEKENVVLAEQERLRNEIAQKRREIDIIQLDRNLRLEAARRDLQLRDDELERLTLVSTKLLEEGDLRRDEVVRERDSKLVARLTNGAKPKGGRPRAQSKAGKNS